VKFLEKLEAEPHRFDLFDVLRWFERSYPQYPRIGASNARSEEILLLGQEPFLDFPGCNISRFDRDAQGRYRLFVRFLGLLGPQGALPLTTTMEAKHWCDMRDDSFARFLDILNHRFLQLYFRAWANARPVAQHDRPDDDHFVDYAGSAIGLASLSFRNRDTIPDMSKLGLAGIMGSKLKSASRVKNILSALFEVDIEVEQFIGSWLTLDRSDQTNLGGPHSALGVGTMIGASVYSVQNKFRIHIFTTSLEQFENFLPSGDFCERLADIVFFYLGEIFDYDVQLGLPEKETRPLSIGKFGRLGWTSWIKSPTAEPKDGMRGDARFHPAERAALIRERRQNAH